MYEYHIFLHAPDDPMWGPRSAFNVWAPSDDCIREIFPHANRIYRFNNGNGAAPGERLVRVA